MRLYLRVSRLQFIIGYREQCSLLVGMPPKRRRLSIVKGRKPERTAGAARGSRFSLRSMSKYANRQLSYREAQRTSINMGIVKGIIPFTGGSATEKAT